MQTALHIRSLVREIEADLVGGRIVGTEFYKKERSAYIFVKRNKSRLALGFVYHPAGSGSFVVPASKVKLDTNEKPWPFFGIDGAEIDGVEQMGLDRIFQLRLSTDSGNRILLFEAIGPNGNIWLLDGEGGKLATLRKKAMSNGEQYTGPQTAGDRINPFDMAPERIAEVPDSTFALRNFLEKGLIGTNRTLAREVLARSGTGDSEDDFEPVRALAAICPIVLEIAGRFDRFDKGYLYQVAGRLEAYPFKLKSVPAEPEAFKSLSLAVQELVSRRQAVVEEADQQKVVMAAVTRLIKRLERRIENLDQDISQAADFETYQRYGELLKINRDRIKKGQPALVVTNVFSNDTEEITIKLDPALDAAANIDQYFRKYRKGREGLQLLERRRQISEAELESWNVILAELDRNFDPARERFRAEIDSALPKNGSTKAVETRLPYREHQLSTGLTIFIGKDGSDNDRTTFEFARPYELWFHAQQCPGSHVVIKFPNKSFEPSKLEIEETAAIAAWHSKARNDSLVPVVYTERRYVRKPRKAKPGLVTVEREKSIMVAPRKPE